MKIILTVFAIYIACAFAHEDEKLPSTSGAQLLKIKCDTTLKLDLLKPYMFEDGFDVLNISTQKYTYINIIVYANKLEIFKSFLESNKIEYEVIVKDVGAEIQTSLADVKLKQTRPRGLEQSILNSFPRYDQIKTYLQTLAESYKDTVTYFSIGKSSESRDLFGVKISSGGKNKSSMLIDAGIHAREWIAPATALYAIKEFVENPDNSKYYKNVDIYIIPLINPDGYEFSHQSERTRLWRKTRSYNKNSRCRGVDGNRNFDIDWGTVGVSNDPCSFIYAGTKPFSIPETAALRDFVLSLKDLRVYVTLHSAANAILYPWGSTSEVHPNQKELQCAAEKAESALAKVRGTRYIIGSIVNTIYPASGGAEDWVIANSNADLSYTFELPNESYGFRAPLSEIEPVGQETFEAFKVMAKYAEVRSCERL